MNYSVTFASVIVGVVGYALTQAGVVVSDGDLNTTIQTIVLILSAGGALWGRYRAGGVSWYGGK